MARRIAHGRLPALTALWILGGAVWMGMPQPAAAAQVISQGESWDAIKRLPDWSGVWDPVTYKQHMLGHGVAPLNNYDIPFQPAVAAKFAELKSIALAGGKFPSRMDRCVNLGVPYNTDHPSTSTQFLFTPGQVTVITPATYRLIYTDGRKHLDDTLTYQGSSLGHWESGGVLVTETVALDPGNEIVMGIQIGKNAKVIERTYLKDRNTLVSDVVVHAPEVLTRPWSYQTVYERSKYPLREYGCTQGDRSLDASTGEYKFDLTPPAE